MSIRIYGRTKRWPKKLRARIFRRDNYTCKGCGKQFDHSDWKGKGLTIDHVIPVSKGGSNRDHNLQTMCSDCNHKKGSEIEPQYIRI